VAIKRKRSFLDTFEGYFEDLEAEFERWREIHQDRPSWSQKNSTLKPLYDMRVTPTEVVMTVDLPFAAEKTVEVKPIDEKTLEVSAEMKKKIRFVELGIVHCEGEFHRLHCHARVPVSVQMDKMDIRFKKRMLEIHLPRQNGR
jgi:HSP20 family molecular chaperone IbpA